MDVYNIHPRVIINRGNNFDLEMRLGFFSRFYVKFMQFVIGLLTLHHNSQQVCGCCVQNLCYFDQPISILILSRGQEELWSLKRLSSSHIFLIILEKFVGLPMEIQQTYNNKFI